jgi:KaiC/GvpD/RAD55 family RecA-like ATPase
MTDASGDREVAAETGAETATESGAERFDLSGALPASLAVPPGTSVLLTAPPGVGTRDLLTALLTAGAGDREGVVAATTEGRTTPLFESLAESYPTARTAMVACGPSGGEPVDADLFHRVASPTDFSGIGVGLSKCAAGVQHDGATAGRVGFESLSTLLRERSREDVVKFCRLGTDRIANWGFLGVFVASEAHGAATMGMVEHAFDARIQVRERDGDREVRVVGPPRFVSDWAPVGD